eukprot:6718464-Prorocentrum_lima.AAC.1
MANPTYKRSLGYHTPKYRFPGVTRASAPVTTSQAYGGSSKQLDYQLPSREVVEHHLLLAQ